MEGKSISTAAKIMVTGCAGFIGFHLSLRLLKEGHFVFGLDNLNDYYDVNLKNRRLQLLLDQDNFLFQKADLEDLDAVDDIFCEHVIRTVVHLAAQAGVRYSLRNPHAYISSNITGFMNILEACRHHRVEHLVFASSSSVYGANTRQPFSVHHNVDHPVSLYAATKKSNELMAHTYSHLYGLPVTGLRFFTVYGPWGRPDMALYIFTKKIMAGKPIQVFNFGKMKRDFTYIDDIVEGMVRLLPRVPAPNRSWNSQFPDPGTSSAPYRIYNIGNNQPVDLMHFISVIEECLGLKAQIEFRPLQDGDVPESFADVDDLMQEVGFRPDTPIETGVQRFVDWYKDYTGTTHHIL